MTVTIDDSVLFWAGISAASVVGAALYICIARVVASGLYGRLRPGRNDPNKEGREEFVRDVATLGGLAWPICLLCIALYYLFIYPVVPRG